MKLCPYCSKEMELSARVCAHCGRDWKTGGGAAPDVTLRQPIPTETTTPDWAWWCVAVILILALVGAYCALIPEIH